MSPVTEIDYSGGASKLIFEEEGRWFGSAIVSLDKHGCVDLHGIRVEKGFRNRGAGRELLRSIEEWGRARHAPAITGILTSIPEKSEEPEVARKFYQKHGFTLRGDRIYKKI